MRINTTYNIDCLEGVRILPYESVDCIVTSPPYFGLRDYGIEGQIGSERCVKEYLSKLAGLFSQLKRVLKSTGTLWLIIGDTYAMGRNSLKNKNLMGLPWELAFSLRDKGWILRQDIIWSKPNPMPESVRDRFTKSHEYIFLFAKSAKYHFDAEAVAEPVTQSTIDRCSQNIKIQKGSTRIPGKTNGPMKAKLPRYGGTKYTSPEDRKYYGIKSEKEYFPNPLKRNKRSVWSVTTKPFKYAHYAVFPQELVRTCILAGCPPGSIVLDPFHGTGTTGLVASKLDRNYIGFELNPEYISIEKSRREKELGLFNNL